MTFIRAAHSENDTKRRKIANNKNQIFISVRYKRVSSLNVDNRIKTRIAILKAREK